MKLPAHKSLAVLAGVFTFLVFNSVMLVNASRTSGPAPTSLPDTLQDVIIYPILEEGHSQQFINQYLYAYAMGNEFMSFRMEDEADSVHSIIIAEFPGEWPDERRYQLSDYSYLTLEAGFIPGDTIWIQ